ncbi:methyltransferase domain-containing protein [Lacinutrix neustonica]|uniref:Methyltransferase domain-containing protein n=1 Tax=Lacinutrix neustonica TaxID=2980107 RepID=A0A9E8SEJ5_9FLAO|nr:methyltransferase domain-containing protein [Lacinutrix neustonica]WAC03618.1 methyltransferase domain-containing protein [Lacinutrix neustonica]
MPLIVSAYVYDLSGYYHFNWLQYCEVSDYKTRKILNINAGFDETSFIIKNKFPQSNLKVFDFYNPKKHTEPAIIRARKVSLAYPNTQAITTLLIPQKEKSVDLIFLLSTAHEIRSNEEKIQFLKECKRVCASNGKVIMVEHLRDLPNFLAFSVGVTHFFSKNTWNNAFKSAGFSKAKETKFTPFMSVFTYQL